MRGIQTTVWTVDALVAGNRLAGTSLTVESVEPFEDDWASEKPVDGVATLYRVTYTNGRTETVKEGTEYLVLN